MVSGDQELLREVKAFLKLTKSDAWDRKLDQDVQAGSLDFGQPEFFSKLQL